MKEQIRQLEEISGELKKFKGRDQRSQEYIEHHRERIDHFLKLIGKNSVRQESVSTFISELRRKFRLVEKPVS